MLKFKQGRALSLAGLLEHQHRSDCQYVMSPCCDLNLDGQGAALTLWVEEGCDEPPTLCRNCSSLAKASCNCRVMSFDCTA